MANGDAACCLEARGISVRYGAVQALSDVSVSFRAGEVHAVVGENGAGKSTLMRVLAGEEVPHAGRVFVDGAPVAFSGPLEARDHGIAVVHQQFQLVEVLSVADNMFLGRPPLRFACGPLSIPDRGAMRRIAAERLGLFGMDRAVDRMVRELGVAERQLVEIARAVGSSSRILVLDEPTASLSAAEADRLFDAVRDMATRGTCVILIAHSLEEVLAIANRITVLRNGHVITTVDREQVDRDALVRLIIGRDLAIQGEGRSRPVARKVLASSRNLIRDPSGAQTSFSLDAGVITGVPTYIGAGVDELLDRLSGAAPRRGDALELDGVATSGMSLRQRVRLGVCLVPGDAMKQGLFPALSVQDNIVIPSARRLQFMGFLSPRRARALALDMIRALDIRPQDPDMKVSRLSGGNRQKVVIAKWLAAGARLLLMDDPTKAVDVGAKVDIFRLMARAASDGAAVLFVSSEVEELVSLCDRILVLHQETLVADFSAPPFAKEAVVGAVVGSRSSVKRDDRRAA